jgi:hypothetical protein
LAASGAGRRAYLLGGLRRFALLLGGAACITALGSLAIGALGGAGVARSLSLGFYVVGSFLLVAGFFLGNRGPARLRGDGAVPLLGSRYARWATREEAEQALSDSAVFVAVGLGLILLGIVADPRMSLF